MTVYNIKTIDFNRASLDYKMFVDTNVLYDTHYSRATLDPQNKNAYRAKYYTNFISDLIKTNKKLYTTVLNITELLVLIEKTEWRIYKNNSRKEIDLKSFRNDTDEREKVIKIIDTTISQISEIYKIIDINVKKDIVDYFISNLNTYKLDPFDYLAFGSLVEDSGLITDDIDFKNSEAIIFTANQKLAGLL